MYMSGKDCYAQQCTECKDQICAPTCCHLPCCCRAGFAVFAGLLLDAKWGSLDQWLRAHGRNNGITPREADYLVYQVVRGLLPLHSHGIVHL